MTSRVRVVVQARTSSSRLPGKSLLPIAGLPMAVLAAKRAQRSGEEVVLATSVDASDDMLTAAVQNAGISVVRGPLNDVLSRYLEATSDLSDDSVIVRLTADNVFPDGELINLAVQDFVYQNVPYLSSTFPSGRLPYGLAVEVFYCGNLRQAARKATTSFQREHVTPWIKSVYGSYEFTPLDIPKDWGRLRCTIDTLEDYHRVNRVFAAIEADPVTVSWRTLCKCLAAQSDAPTFQVPMRSVNGAPHSVLVLGTAQLGMEYGRTNKTGCPSEEEAARLIRTAISHGVTHIDTARAYGLSESRIGRVLSRGYASSVTVVTKLDPLEGLGPEATASTVGRAVESSVYRSCRELRVPCLDVLILHRASFLESHRGQVWERLRHLRDEGVLQALGASVQTVPEARRALAEPEISFVQLPFNILDWRWADQDFQNAIQARPDVTVHSRSPLLQGILATEDPTIWPRVPGVAPGDVLENLAGLTDRLGRRNVVDLCLAYVRAQDWIHGIVLGVETIDQFLEAGQLCMQRPLTATECRTVQDWLEPLPEALLNPASWPIAQ